MLTTAEIAPSLRPGMHAATFGGNPLAARAGIATLEAIEQQQLLNQATVLGEQFRQRLEAIKTQNPIIREVRVVGLMIGIELEVEGAPIVQSCLDRQLLVNSTQGTVIRLLPALTLTSEQLEEGCDVLADVLSQFET